MALLDDIKKRLQAAKASVQTGEGAATQQATQRLLKAKSGKATQTAGPRASAIGATVATQATQGALAQQQLQGATQAVGIQQAQQQQAQQGDLARQQLASERRMATSGRLQSGVMGREALAAGAARTRMQLDANEINKIASMRNVFSTAIQDIASQKRIAIDDIFQNYEQSNQKLAYRKDGAELQQLGHQLAMQNDIYLQELYSIGKLRGLADSIAFNEETARLVLGDNLNDIINQLGWQRSFDMDVRDFQDVIEGMSIDDAISIANATINDANKRAIATGVISGSKVVADTTTKKATG